jgi:hypothetical protein
VPGASTPPIYFFRPEIKLKATLALIAVAAQGALEDPRWVTT